MSNIREEIVYDVDKKYRIMETILLTMINSPQILELNELSIIKSGDIKYIKQEELVAIYSLGLELRKSIMLGPKRDKRLEEYLWNKDGLVNRENLLKFVDYEVSDMIRARIDNPKLNWKLNVNKIFKGIDENEAQTKIYKIRDEKEDS